MMQEDSDPKTIRLGKIMTPSLNATQGASSMTVRGPDTEEAA